MVRHRPSVREGSIVGRLSVLHAGGRCRVPRDLPDLGGRPACQEGARPLSAAMYRRRRALDHCNVALDLCRSV
jgi:hypothetical protein